jgi:hypothetical protein
MVEEPAMNPAVIRCPLIHVLVIIILLASAGCGGGGGGGGTKVIATEAVTTHYPSGRIEATGYVEAGTTIKTGLWVVHHDVDGSPEKWRGWYRDDAVDTARPWIEHNQDGSIRHESGDR